MYRTWPVLCHSNLGTCNSRSPLNCDGLVHLAMVETSDTLSFGNVTHMFSIISSFIVCFWCPRAGFHENSTRPQVPAAAFPEKAWHCNSSLLFHFQTSVSNHHETIPVINGDLAGSPVATCCLQVGAFLFPFYNFFFVSNCLQESGQIVCGLVIFGICAGLRRTHLNPLVALRPSRYLREIDTVRLGP